MYPNGANIVWMAQENLVMSVLEGEFKGIQMPHLKESQV